MHKNAFFENRNNLFICYSSSFSASSSSTPEKKMMFNYKSIYQLQNRSLGKPNIDEGIIPTPLKKKARCFLLTLYLHLFQNNSQQPVFGFCGGKKCSQGLSGTKGTATTGIFILGKILHANRVFGSNEADLFMSKNHWRWFVCVWKVMRLKCSWRKSNEADFLVPGKKWS